MSSKELIEYEEAAIYRARNKINSRIKNGSIEHANILVRTMIDHASDSDDIYVYSGCLPQKAFGTLANTKAKRVNILVDNETDLKWVDTIPAPIKSKISISKIATPRKNHFLCTTGGFFRFETDAENYEAEANFNEMQAVEILVKAFERYSEGATKAV